MDRCRGPDIEMAPDSVGICGEKTNRQCLEMETDRQTDKCYQMLYLPCFAVDYEVYICRIPIEINMVKHFWSARILAQFQVTNQLFGPVHFLCVKLAHTLASDGISKVGYAHTLYYMQVFHVSILSNTLQGEGHLSHVYFERA